MIEVVVDDLAFVEADAILRPADDTLAPLTPAMKRLDLQAGPRFAALCRVQSPLDAGAAVVTAGGDLSAPLVVHLVLQDADGSGGRDVIRRALRSAWQQAAAWQLERVAAPLIGVGPGRLSIEDAAELLGESLPPGNQAGGAPHLLRIVVDTEAERETVDAAIRKYRS
jgi:O-acetyl-ADP-ribose deacetylase (regulator of RNase III)